MHLVMRFLFFVFAVVVIRKYFNVYFAEKKLFLF